MVMNYYVLGMVCKGYLLICSLVALFCVLDGVVIVGLRVLD